MKELSDIEIAAKLRSGKRFTVQTARERARVYSAARALGIKAEATASVKGGFDVAIFVEATT